MNIFSILFRGITAHLDTGFIGYFRLQANAEVVSKYQVVTAYFSCNLPDLNSSQTNPSVVRAIKLPFKII
jgi:hypothetical protein